MIILDSKPRTLRVGMCPDPFMETEWSRTANPMLHWQAEAIQAAGAEIVGLQPRQAQNPEIWPGMNLDVIHLHWSAGVFNFRVRREPLQKIIPHAFVQKWTQVRLDQWEKSVRKVGLPMIWEIHDTLSHHAIGFNYNADFALHARFYALANGILLHGESCYQPVKDLFGAEKNFEISPLGSFRALYGLPISRTAALEALGLPCSGKVFSYLGTARPMRNAKESILAFLKAAGEKDLFLVAGGNVEHYLPDSLDNRIRVYPGVIPLDLFLQLICASDFTINDGIRYLTSGIIRVAMSYGCPVFAHPFGSALDMAREAAIWILDTADGLASAIQTTLQMPEESRLFLSAGASRNEELFTWQANGEACLRIYQRFLK